jgi:hypothetical protein
MPRTGWIVNREETLMKFFRTAGLVAVAAMTLGACEPKKYQLMPLEEAMHRVPTPLVAQLYGPTPPVPGVPEGPVRVGQAYWQATGTVFQLPNDFVRPVATLNGIMFHSLAWDQEPFDRLFVPAPGSAGSWVQLLDVY